MFTKKQSKFQLYNSNSNGENSFEIRKISKTKL